MNIRLEDEIFLLKNQFLLEIKLPLMQVDLDLLTKEDPKNEVIMVLKILDLPSLSSDSKSISRLLLVEFRDLKLYAIILDVILSSFYHQRLEMENFFTLLLHFLNSYQNRTEQNRTDRNRIVNCLCSDETP